MKHYCFEILLLVIKTCFISSIIAEIEGDTWMDPDAWARDLASDPLNTKNDKCCKCSENNILEHPDPKENVNNARQTFVEDTASLIYFKKFITILFNRKAFKYDSTQQIYERSIVFTVQSYQMNKLEQLQDPRDLDSILADILNNVRTPNMYSDGQQQLEASTGLKAIVLNILYDMWQLTKTSEMRFLFFVAIVILIGWIFNTRFNIGWLPMTFFSIFVFGYLHTYLECNRELEVNEMMEVLNRDRGCDHAQGSKFIKFFKGMFYSDDVQSVQQQKIKQSARISLGFCRPDHVFVMYFNDIFLKYLQVLIEQCTVTLGNLNSAFSFPYNILSGFFLVCMIGYVVKLTFKYIFNPSAWASFMHTKQLYQAERVAIKRIHSQDDRISGDNLKLLLNAFNAVPQQNAVAQKLQTPAAVSGVQDVKEALETNSEKNSAHLDNSKENILDEKTDSKIEDSSNDS